MASGAERRWESHQAALTRVSARLSAALSTDGSDEALVGRLDGVEVLPDDAVHLATALRNVALD